MVKVAADDVFATRWLVENHRKWSEKVSKGRSVNTLGTPKSSKMRAKVSKGRSVDALGGACRPEGA